MRTVVRNNFYVCVQLYAYVMCHVCVQLYAYVTCGQVSVKRSYDTCMYEPYAYVKGVHYMK